jgi:hypothetical protein
LLGKQIGKDIRLLCFAISGVNVILLGPNLSSG